MQEALGELFASGEFRGMAKEAKKEAVADAIRQFNERLMTDPDYAALLDAYGANMLYPSGSRALRRELEQVALKPGF